MGARTWRTGSSSQDRVVLGEQVAVIHGGGTKAEGTRIHEVVTRRLGIILMMVVINKKTLLIMVFPTLRDYTTTNLGDATPVLAYGSIPACDSRLLQILYILNKRRLMS